MTTAVTVATVAVALEGVEGEATVVAEGGTPRAVGHLLAVCEEGGVAAVRHGGAGVAAPGVAARPLGAVIPVQGVRVCACVHVHVCVCACVCRLCMCLCLCLMSMSTSVSAVCVYVCVVCERVRACV